MEIVISPSIKQKLDATINCTKRISFGDSNYSDLTKHKYYQRKGAYVARHKQRKIGVNQI